MPAGQLGLVEDARAEPRRIRRAPHDQIRHLVGPVDEGEHPYPAELVVQRLDQQHREVREAGDGPRHIAEQHQLGACGAAPPQHRPHRDASGRQRAAQRPPQIDPPACGAPSPGREAGGELPRQRPHDRAQFVQLGPAREQEVDPVRRAGHGTPRHTVPALALGDPPSGLGPYPLPEGLDPPPDLVVRESVGEVGTGDAGTVRGGLPEQAPYPREQRLRTEPGEGLVRGPAVGVR
jgi:hypothetical protein